MGDEMVAVGGDRIVAGGEMEGLYILRDLFRNNSETKETVDSITVHYKGVNKQGVHLCSVRVCENKVASTIVIPISIFVALSATIQKREAEREAESCV